MNSENSVCAKKQKEKSFSLSSISAFWPASSPAARQPSAAAHQPSSRCTPLPLLYLAANRGSLPIPLMRRARATVASPSFHRRTGLCSDSSLMPSPISQELACAPRPQAPIKRSHVCTATHFPNFSASRRPSRASQPSFGSRRETELAAGAVSVDCCPSVDRSLSPSSV
jgi:hypothetical protein